MSRSAADLHKAGFQNLSFVSLDVETASRASGAICQIGLARVQAGEIVSSRSWLVRPVCPFDPAMSRLHGICVDAVAAAPRWREVYAEVRREVHGQQIVSHTLFDRGEIWAACCHAGVPMFSYMRWLDSCAIARCAWPGLASYRLKSLAAHIGFSYKPHEAEEDARASAAVYLEALSALEQIHS